VLKSLARKRSLYNITKPKLIVIAPFRAEFVQKLPGDHPPFFGKMGQVNPSLDMKRRGK
jgi:hypothetical protein